MAFGDILQTGYPPDEYPYGAGGDDSVVWHCGYTSDADTGYEYAPSDLSQVRSSELPSTSGWAQDIGGTDAVIYYCADEGAIHELSPSDFSSVSSSTSPATTADGIGGNENVVWHRGYDGGTYDYELSPSDFSTVKSTQTSSYGGYGGIGGNENDIWSVGSDNLNHRSPSDFSVIEGTPLDSFSSPRGVGGSSDSIWLADSQTQELHELDTPVEPPSAPSNLSAQLL